MSMPTTPTASTTCARCSSPKRRRVPVYMDEPTSRALHARFGYCFMTPPGSQYPPIAAEHRLVPGTPVTIEGQGGSIEALPVLQEHGDIPSLGFRIGDVAYSADIKAPAARRASRRWPGSRSGSWTRCARRRIRAI